MEYIIIWIVAALARRLSLHQKEGVPERGFLGDYCLGLLDS